MSLYLGIPVYAGRVPTRFVSSLLELLAVPGQVSLDLRAGASYPGKCRNEIVAEFLERSNAERILFIDHDVLFTKDQVIRIARHEEPIVGGFYFKKEEGAAKAKVVAEALGAGTVELKPADARGLMEVKYIGTGFLCVKREVFEKMMRMPSVDAYRDEHSGERHYDLFKTGVHRGLGRWLSEDWWFCQRARDMGYKIYGDGEVVLPHLGEATYPLPSADRITQLEEYANELGKEKAKLREELQQTRENLYAGLDREPDAITTPHLATVAINALALARQELAALAREELARRA